MKKVIAAFLCSAWLVLGGATGESGQAQAQEKKLTDITFSLDFITLGRHAPFYVAIDKGFYKDEGLDVSIDPGSGSVEGINRVASGAYEMGFVQEVVSTGQALPRALELAETIAAYPNFPGIQADRRATLHGLERTLDEGLLLEAREVRPTCFSDELREGLTRFAAGARDASPRPPITSEQ